MVRLHHKLPCFGRGKRLKALFYLLPILLSHIGMIFSVKDRKQILNYFGHTQSYSQTCFIPTLMRIKLSCAFTNSPHRVGVPRSFTFHTFYFFPSSPFFLLLLNCAFQFVIPTFPHSSIPAFTLSPSTLSPSLQPRPHPIPILTLPPRPIPALTLPPSLPSPSVGD